MTRCLISFDDGAMDFLRGDLEEVGEAAHRVLREAKAAGVWVTGGGLERQQAHIVDPDSGRPASQRHVDALKKFVSSCTTQRCDD